MTSCPPIFLFGMERSGTTLLAMMVGAHPDIAVPLATTSMWYDFEERLAEYNLLATPADVERLVDDVAAHERIRLWRTSLDSARIVKQSRVGQFSTVVAAFHREYARQHAKPCWGNCDIGTLDEMHRSHQWFSNARFVHIVRDGRDVALSHQTMPYGRGNVYECAESWSVRLTTNLRMGAILGAERYHVVRYEALILEPEKTLTHLCEFLGVPYSPLMLDYGATVDERVPPDKQWLWPALKMPPQPAKVARWRQEMPVTQRIVFESVAASLLKELGYPVFDHVPRRLSSQLLELLYLLDRGGRSKRLLARIGVRRKTLLEKKSSEKR